MQKNTRDLLEKGLNQISDELCCQRISDQVCTLFDEITLFNPVYHLVDASEDELVVKHFLDCLAVYPVFRSVCSTYGKGAKACDLGSGAGLPGLLLASAFPLYCWTLVERMGRRAGFLRNADAMMKTGVSVVESDLSEVRMTYDIVTFRAFRKMRDIARDLRRITETGSVVIAYKARIENINEDIDELEMCIPGVFSHEIINYEVPFLDAGRSLLILKREN